MHIAFVLYSGMTALDFTGAYDPLTRLKTMGLMDDVTWELCALEKSVTDQSGLVLAPTMVGAPLEGFDLLIVPGGSGARKYLEETPEAQRFVAWIQTARDIPLKASVCTGALLLGAAGFLKGKRATTHPTTREELRLYCAEVSAERVVDEGEVVTAGGVTAGIDLGLYLVERIAGPERRARIQAQMDYPGTIVGAANSGGSRRATVERRTNETQVQVSVGIDGSGAHQIDTGIGFLDHMLTHLAVHGLFDLAVEARGDLHVDTHHTVEDVALALGEAFAQAWGDRLGIVRMGSAYAPMDETLALVVVDLSGRPYAVIEASWHAAEVGGIPTNLMAHFLESFAFAARINLHACVIAGRDDHHQAEALFKALARSLDAATRIDPRRANAVPSTKGSLA